MANHLLRGSQPGPSVYPPEKPVYRAWLYKGDEARIFEGLSQVSDALAKGWFDNREDAKAAEADAVADSGDGTNPGPPPPPPPPPPPEPPGVAATAVPRKTTRRKKAAS